jgi:hypothetical protein
LGPPPGIAGLPLIADMWASMEFVAVGQKQKWPTSFDHLLDGCDNIDVTDYAERLRGFQVYDQFEFGRLLDW